MKKLDWIKGFIITGLVVMSFICTSCFNSETKTCVLVTEDNSSYFIESEIVFDKVEAILTNRTDLRIIDRDRVDAIQEEMSFQQTDWSDTSKTAEIGKALNADVITFVGVTDKSYKVTFLDVNTFQKKTYTGDLTVSRKGELKKVKGLSKLKKFQIS